MALMLFGASVVRAQDDVVEEEVITEEVVTEEVVVEHDVVLVEDPHDDVVVVETQEVVVVEDEEVDSPRFRFGFTIGGGGIVGQSAGVVAGAQIRLGVQFNEWVGLFYQGHGLGGAFIDAENAGAIGAALNTLMVELLIFDTLHLGVGPSVDAGAFGVCNESGCGGQTGAFFGIDGRVALTLGSHGIGSDSGFSISANVHPIFFDGFTLVTITGGIGGEWM
jgi:hypothetical protein